VIFAPGSIPVTPEVIGADLANVDIAFLRFRQNPLSDPTANPAAAEDAKTGADLSNYVINNADASQLTSIGFTIGHILGGTNAVGDYLAKLVTDELMIGDGRGFVGVNENLNAYISTFFGPRASEAGGVVQFLNAVAGGWPPELAYPATLASSPIQLRTT
jgi:hypothetical protein